MASNTLFPAQGRSDNVGLPHLAIGRHAWTSLGRTGEASRGIVDTHAPRPTRGPKRLQDAGRCRLDDIQQIADSFIDQHLYEDPLDLPSSNRGERNSSHLTRGSGENNPVALARRDRDTRQARLGRDRARHRRREPATVGV